MKDYDNFDRTSMRLKSREINHDNNLNNSAMSTHELNKMNNKLRSSNVVEKEVQNINKAPENKNEQTDY